MSRISTGYFTPPVKKAKPVQNTKKQRRNSTAVCSTSTEIDSNVIEALMKSPETRKMVLELLADNKDLIEDYKKQTADNLNKVTVKSGKKKKFLEGPIALARRRALEEMEGKSPSRLNSPLSSTSSTDNVVSRSNLVPLDKIFSGVIAYVEVKNKDQDRSSGAKHVLKSMGAVVRENFSNDVTHVIFKDGSFKTYQKAKLLKVHLVSVLWIEISRSKMCRQSEKLYPALGTEAYNDDSSIVCSQLQKEYEEIVREEYRRSLTNGNPLPTTQHLIQRRKTSILHELDSSSRNSSYHSLKDIQNVVNNLSDVQNGEEKISKYFCMAGPASKLPTDSTNGDNNNGKSACGNNIESNMDLALSDMLDSTRRRRSQRRTKNNRRKTVIGIFLSEEPSDSNSNESCEHFPEIFHSPQITEVNNFSDSSDSFVFSQNCAKTVNKDKPLHIKSLMTEESDISVNGLKSLKNASGTPVRKYTPKKSLTQLKTSGTRNRDASMEILHEPNGNEFLHSSESEQNRRLLKLNSSTREKSNNSFKNSSKKSNKSLSTTLNDSSDIFLDAKESSVASNHSVSGNSSRRSLRLLSRRNTSLESRTKNEDLISNIGIMQSPVNLDDNVDSDVSCNSTDSEIIINRKYIDTKQPSVNSSTEDSAVKKDSGKVLKNSTGFQNKELHIELDQENISNNSTTINGTSSKSDNSQNEIDKNKSKRKVKRRLYNPNEPISITVNDDEEREQRKKAVQNRKSKNLVTVTLNKMAETPKNQKTDNEETVIESTLERTPKKKSNADDEQQPEISNIETPVTTRTRKNTFKRQHENEQIDKTGSKRQKRDRQLSQNRRESDEDETVHTQQTQTPLSCPRNRRSTLEFRLIKKSAKKLKKSAENRPAIVCTRFNTDDVRDFNANVKKLGKFETENKVSNRTTHVVAREPKRTINMLRAICRGCWILKYDWILSSLQSGRWLPEEDYEVTDFSPMVQKSRLQRQAFGSTYTSDVFANCGGIFVSLHTTPCCSDLKELITLCKGKIVNTARMAKIIIGDYFTYEGVMCLKESWVLDSITFGELMPFNDTYLLKKKSRRLKIKC